MGDEKTAWHPGFAAYVESQKPPGVVVEAEVVISHQQRADLILLRRDGPRPVAGGDLELLWRVMPRFALLEYKSRSRPPGPGVVHQLLGYGHTWARRRLEELPAVDDLALVLVSPSLNPALQKDLGRLGVAAEAVETGLYRVAGLVFPTWILSLNELSVATGHALLGFFGSHGLQTLDDASRGWLEGHYHMANIESIKNLPGFDDMKDTLADSEMGELIFRRRLKSMPVDEVLAELLRTRREELPAELRELLKRSVDDSDDASS